MPGALIIRGDSEESIRSVDMSVLVRKIRGQRRRYGWLVHGGRRFAFFEEMDDPRVYAQWRASPIYQRSVLYIHNERKGGVPRRFSVWPFPRK
jgi:hypothetical protein